MTPVGLMMTREVLKPCRKSQAFSWASPCFFLPWFFLQNSIFALNKDPDPSFDIEDGENRLTVGKGMAWQARKEQVRKGGITFLPSFCSLVTNGMPVLLPMVFQSCLDATYTPLQEFLCVFEDHSSNAYAWFSRSDSSIWWKSFYGRKSKK